MREVDLLIAVAAGAVFLGFLFWFAEQWRWLRTSESRQHEWRAEHQRRQAERLAFIEAAHGAVCAYADAFETYRDALSEMAEALANMRVTRSV